MGTDWNKRDTAISDFEAKCIRGQGSIKSGDMLRNIAAKSVYEKAWIAAAERIEELEKEAAEGRLWKEKYEWLKYDD